MKNMRRISFLALPLCAAGLTACASLLGGDEVNIRPINNMSGLTGEPRDPLYESAVTAIDQRDYGRALDYLQEDKARDPRNIKVLNALGVVYDKLGRFDLSARYYAQASSIDPASRIVAANMGYSNALQGLMSPGRGTVVRMDLPSDFNTLPAGKPTVVAVAPEAGMASHPIESPAASAQPAAVIASMPLVKAATVSPMPKFVQPPLVQEAKPTVASDSVPFAKTMEPSHVAAPPLTVAAKPHVAKPVIVAATPAKAEAMTKSPAEAPEIVALKNAPPVAVAAMPLVAKLVIAAVPANVATIAKPPAQVAETVAVNVAAPMAFVATPPVAKPVIVAAAPATLPVAQSARPVLQSRHAAALPAVPAKANPKSAQAVLAALSAKKVFLIGQPVRLINASGKADRVGIVSRRLGALGWTIRLTGAGPAQLVTTLIYNPRNSGAAKAMQRTLPFPVRLVAERGAVGMRLVVGRDYLSWKPKNARVYALWQKAPAVAGLQKISLKGGR
jgi:hypothetical protein